MLSCGMLWYTHTSTEQSKLIKEGIDMEMMEADILSCYSNKAGGVETEVL